MTLAFVTVLSGSMVTLAILIKGKMLYFMEILSYIENT